MEVLGPDPDGHHQHDTSTPAPNDPIIPDTLSDTPIPPPSPAQTPQIPTAVAVKQLLTDYYDLKRGMVFPVRASPKTLPFVHWKEELLLKVDLMGLHLAPTMAQMEISPRGSQSVNRESLEAGGVNNTTKQQTQQQDDQPLFPIVHPLEQILKFSHNATKQTFTYHYVDDLSPISAAPTSNNNNDSSSSSTRSTTTPTLSATEYRFKTEDYTQIFNKVGLAIAIVLKIKQGEFDSVPLEESVGKAQEVLSTVQGQAEENKINPHTGSTRRVVTRGGVAASRFQQHLQRQRMVERSEIVDNPARGDRLPPKKLTVVGDRTLDGVEESSAPSTPAEQQQQQQREEQSVSNIAESSSSVLPQNAESQKEYHPRQTSQDKKSLRHNKSLSFATSDQQYTKSIAEDEIIPESSNDVTQAPSSTSAITHQSQTSHFSNHKQTSWSTSATSATTKRRPMSAILTSPFRSQQDVFTQNDAQRRTSRSNLKTNLTCYSEADMLQQGETSSGGKKSHWFKDFWTAGKNQQQTVQQRQQNQSNLQAPRKNFFSDLVRRKNQTEPAAVTQGKSMQSLKSVEEVQESANGVFAVLRKTFTLGRKATKDQQGNSKLQNEQGLSSESVNLSQLQPEQSPLQPYTTYDALGQEVLNFKVIQNKHQVASGTIKELVSLLFQQDTSSEYVKMFLFTFQGFLSIQDLLRQMEELFLSQLQLSQHVASGEGGASAGSTLDYEVFVQRFVDVIQTWVEQHPRDFQESPARNSLYKVLKLLDTAHCSLGSQRIRSIVQAIPRYSFENATVFPSITTHEKKRHLTEFDLTKLTSKILAWHITVVDFELMNSVNPDEFIRFLYTPDTKETHPNLKAFIARFNQISAWVPTVILSSDEIRRRVDVLEKFIKIGGELLEVNNFNAAYAILSGLSMAPVNRLKKTWALVGTKYMGIYQVLQESLSYVQNYKLYRKLLNESKAPAIPILSILMKDLTFAQEGNSTLLSNGLVNFDKFRGIYQLIHRMSAYRNESGEFSADDVQAEALGTIQLTTYCRHLPVFAETNLLKLSKILEPPETPARAPPLSSEDSATFNLTTLVPVRQNTDTLTTTGVTNASKPNHPPPLSTQSTSHSVTTTNGPPNVNATSLWRTKTLNRQQQKKLEYQDEFMRVLETTIVTPQTTVVHNHNHNHNSNNNNDKSNSEDTEQGEKDELLDRVVANVSTSPVGITPHPRQKLMRRSSSVPMALSMSYK